MINQDFIANDEPAQTEKISLGEALNLWVNLTSHEPGQRNIYTLLDMHITSLHREIQEALDLDPTEVTGKMILSYIVQNYFEDRTFTVDEMLNEPEKVSHYLSKAKSLANYLRSNEVVTESNAFAEKICQTLEHYGAATTELLNQIHSTGPHGDRAGLAILRRDALKSFKNLQINQFLDGQVEQDDYKPVYGKFLHRWNNINSMLKAAVTAPSGVTVNMIQTNANPYGVYFVFAIRNGGRLFTFTDKEWTPHPLAESMWRRPDKILAARAGRNWFPYDLAGLKFNDEGKPYLETSSGTSLVPYQTTSEPIKRLSELNHNQVIWITMMLDLIVDKFWGQGHKEKQLSYTGEMIKVASPLLDAAENANLPIDLRSDTTLTMEPLTLQDVHTKNVIQDDVGKMMENPNSWLEERYCNQVLPESLNLVSEDTTETYVSFLPMDSYKKKTQQTKSDSKDLVISAQIKTKKEISHTFQSIFDRDDALQMMASINSLDATSFGTKDELHKDRVFLARTSYASQIDTLANLEFQSRRDEVETWVKAKVTENFENLRSLFAQKDIMIKTEVDSNPFSSYGVCGVKYDITQMRREFVKHYDLSNEKEDFNYRSYGRSPILLGQLLKGHSRWRCFLTGSACSHSIQVSPETVEQLAFLCGVQVKDLPDVLQHWTKIKKYQGNHITTKIDPILWKLHNPWNDLDFKVSLFVSKRSYNEIAKFGLEKPWHEPESWSAN